MAKSLIKFIDIKRVEDDCILSWGQFPDTIPFPVKRIYSIVQSKKGLARGLHAHHKLKQVIFCLHGKFRLILDNGRRKEGIVLDQPNRGVYLPPMVWHEMVDLNENTVLFVVASEKYDSKDYIRSYDEFLQLIHGKKRN